MSLASEENIWNSSTPIYFSNPAYAPELTLLPQERELTAYEDLGGRLAQAPSTNPAEMYAPFVKEYDPDELDVTTGLMNYGLGIMTVRLFNGEVENGLVGLRKREDRYRYAAGLVLYGELLARRARLFQLEDASAIGGLTQLYGLFSEEWGNNYGKKLDRLRMVLVQSGVYERAANVYRGMDRAQKARAARALKGHSSMPLPYNVHLRRTPLATLHVVSGRPSREEVTTAGYYLEPVQAAV